MHHGASARSSGMPVCACSCTFNSSCSRGSVPTSPHPIQNPLSDPTEWHQSSKLIPQSLACCRSTIFPATLCYSLCPPPPPPPPLPWLLLQCVYCSIWMKNSLGSGVVGDGEGGKVSSRGITDVHTHLQTHFALFLAFLCYFSHLLSFCLLRR